MPTPTTKGQYRRVRYADDGCDIYQCLWCLQTIEIRDDPQYGWNFCPKCGQSWFHKLQCRDHEVPRWYYDRWGNRGSYDETILMFGKKGGPLKEVRTADIPMYGNYQQPTSEWVVECRTKWFDDPWGEWKYEGSQKKDPFKTDWQRAKQMLEYYRGRHDYNDHDDIKFEHRVRLRKIT